MALKASVVYESGRYPFAAPAAVSPGDVVARPDGSFAIYDGLTNAASGALIEAEPIIPCRVVEFVAKTTDTWSAAATVYWDATNKELTSTSSGNTAIGKAIKAKTSGQTSARLVCS